MQKYILTPALAALLLTTAFANVQAQENMQTQENNVLKPVIITGSMTPVEQNKSGHAYTVITGKQMEENQVRSVADALRQVPGFAVSRTGALGGLTQVRVRGGEADHLLVLIDGIEANGFSTGGYDFGSLMAVDIDRIEILRGPQSSFYGSNAMTGVVNIITKRGTRDGWKITGQTEGGSHNSWQGGVLLQGGAENYDLAVSANYLRTDGFNIAAFGHDKEGTDNLTLNGKLNIDVTDNLALDATLRFVKHKVEGDSQDFSNWGSPSYGHMADSDDWTKTDDFIGSIGFTHKSLDGALTQRGRLSNFSNESKYLFAGDRSMGNRGSRTTASYQISYDFDTPTFADAHHTISGGVDWKREKYRYTTPLSSYVPANAAVLDWQKRDSYGFVGEYKVELFNQFDFSASIRQDQNDDFKDATTFSVASSWRIPNSGSRLHASVGTGVVNPSMTDLYGYYFNYVPNSSLKPEESFGWDIGIEQTFWNGILVGDITYFNQDLDHEIGSQAIAGGKTQPYNMDGKSERQGIETSLTLDLQNGFTAGATYTYTDSEDPKGKREVRRPEHSGSMNLAYRFYEERARVFAEAVFNGNMKDSSFVTFPSKTVGLDSYTVVNIGGSFKINKNLEAFGRIENLFDEDYQEVYDYKTAGRTAYIGLKGSF